MKNLSRNILNYFATFTETKFSFRTIINYRWTDNELTLDFSLYPEFQDLLVNKVKSNNSEPVIVKYGDYVITLKSDDILFETGSVLKDSFDNDYLIRCIEEKEKEIRKGSESVVVVSEDAKAEMKGNKLKQKEDDEIKKQALKDGIRKFNQSFRIEYENIITKLQNKKLKELEESYHFVGKPNSTVNIRNYAQKHFDNWQQLGNKAKDADDYFAKLEKYLKDKSEDIIIYDLYTNIKKFQAFRNVGTQYLFFHGIQRNGSDEPTEQFPLYFAEVEILEEHDHVQIRFARDLLFVNTSAINYFQYERVLTTPRACTFDLAESVLSIVEGFLQSQYSLGEPFILEPNFRPIKSPNDVFPDINFRIGFQVVQKEDKKLLDYSELMTNDESGATKKFVEFINKYINGNIENTRDEVDKEFREKFPTNSPQRYISDNPLPLNKAQKNILLALKNQKNKIVVVDGPPGTGKSHTIAGIIYWANQNHKSVVVSSHKKEALDVIERMLADKFKQLHPQTKPSIMRFSKDNSSKDNSPQITLSTPVINSATERVSDFNEKAIKQDEKAILDNIENKLKHEFSGSADYKVRINALFQFEQITKKLSETGVFTEQELNVQKTRGVKINFSILEALSANENLSLVNGWSFEQFKALLKRRREVPVILESCEKINTLEESILALKPASPSIPAEFYKLIDKSGKLLDTTKPIAKLTANDAAKTFLSFGKNKNKEARAELVKDLKKLEYQDLYKDISQAVNKPAGELTIADTVAGLKSLEQFFNAQSDIERVNSFKTDIQKTSLSHQELYKLLSDFKKLIADADADCVQSLENLFNYYEVFVAKLGIVRSDIYTLVKLAELDEQEKEIWNWIKNHNELSQSDVYAGLSQEDLDAYYRIKQKEVEHLNDEHVKNLNKYLNEIEQIKVALNNNQRLDKEQAKVITDNLACVIAEPEIISKYFPMENDMIDLLVLDEASQVSIAESISLILRAKQVVVFGDELQYGAVSAVNVSAKYQSSYFLDVIDGYSKDCNQKISEQERAELLGDVSQEVGEDEQVIEEIKLPQNDGTVHWLKTFNIRTSTLSFSKAIANYNTSLREHFRSFREIIEYSNEYFYRPCQMELIVNRIRTKPIDETLIFIKIETKGHSGQNVNLDEIEFIKNDIEERIKNGFKGTIGIISSFRDQKEKLENILRKQLSNYRDLEKKHKLAIWFVGDVQGEERDIVYYTFVQDKKFQNADLKTIYPVVGGSADSIKSLKMQRLNVGFSRAKDTMVFVHSMPLKDYKDTRLGDALEYYNKLYQEAKENDFVVDEAVFDSEMEKWLYQLLVQTPFVKKHHKSVKIIPQFNIGEYLRSEFKACLPKYRADFLLVYSRGGKEQTLIIEYDGVEWHTKNPDIVTKHNFTQEYLDYDINRQLELESYGYRFLRINKFTLIPESKDQTEIDVLNNLLENNFNTK